MNIENHFLNADAFLEMAKEKVDNGDYVGAQFYIAKAYGHTRELLDHVQKLVALKANCSRHTEVHER